METYSYDVRTETGNGPPRHSSCRPVSLLDTVDELFEKILLTRVLRDVNESGLLCDDQFGFRPRHSTTLQMACRIERVNRNFDERRLTGAIFLDVAKAFDTVWVKDRLCKPTVLDFPSYLATLTAEHYRRPSNQPRLQAVSCGLDWSRGTRHLRCSVRVQTTYPHFPATST
jgi:hypothetical protein